MTACITGTGIITSLGASRSVVFERLCQGVSGPKPLGGFPRDKFNMNSAHEIDDRPTAGLDRPLRCTDWLVAAVRAALEESGLDPRRTRIAVVVGTGLRELRSFELWRTESAPFEVGQLHFGAAVRRALTPDTPVYTLANACSASNFALGLATDLIALDQAEVVIAAGCDSITETMFGILDRVSLSKPESVRPFDRDRRGVIMGEGAAAVVVEPLNHARARGARSLALVRGVGMSCDAYHETAPSVAGMSRAMCDAYDRAGLDADSIDLILAHGTGTPLNDLAEAKALRPFFGERDERVLVTAIKSMTGHTSGASGLVGVIAAIESMRTGRVPPTLGLIDPIEEADCLQIVRGAALETPVRFSQVNAFGFGGVNAVAVLERSS